MFLGISNKQQLYQCKAAEDCIWHEQRPFWSCNNLYIEYHWNTSSESKRFRHSHKFL